MVKIQSKKYIKLFLFGFFLGIFLSGLFLLIIKNPHVDPKFLLDLGYSDTLSERSTGSIICVNIDQDNQEFPLLNLNSASIDELKSLPGIGDVKAKSIIAWREKYGNFKNISELMYISGISDTLFQQICNKITIEE
jgi:competence ComEA-like helix-hairpin-helix protein